MGWGDGSEAESMYCLYRGPEFGSQYPLQATIDLPVSLATGNEEGRQVTFLGLPLGWVTQACHGWHRGRAQWPRAWPAAGWEGVVALSHLGSTVEVKVEETMGPLGRLWGVGLYFEVL